MISQGCADRPASGKVHSGFIILLLLAFIIPVPGIAGGAEAIARKEPGSRTDGAVFHAAAGSKKPLSRTSALTVAEYYEKASPVNIAGLPDRLRVSHRGLPGGRVKAPPIIASQCLHFAPGEFSHLFLRSPYARRLRELFVEDGVDAGKMTNLLIAHGSGEGDVVTIFDEGFMILFDEAESAAYIFPIGGNMGAKVFNLTR